MLLRSAGAIAGVALGLSGCPGHLTEEQLAAFEGSARAAAGDEDAKDAATEATCPSIPALLKATCTDAGCHGSTKPAGGLNLFSPAYAARWVDVPSSSKSCGGELLIDTAKPENSLIYTQLAPRPACGLTMPLGKPALSAEQRACVLAWIKAGAPADENVGASPASDAGLSAPDPASNDRDAGTPQPPDVAVGTELSRAGWVASASRTGTQTDVSAAQTALDNDLTTRWGTGLPQDGTTDWFQVDMVSVRTFSSIELRMGMWDQDHPRNYKVYASNDPNSWGSAVTMGMTADQKQPVLTLTFAAQTARYIRMENTGVDANNWWSIYEFIVKR